MRIKSLAVVLLAISVLISFTGCTGKKKDNTPKVFSFERISKAEGLPNNNINCIAAFGDKVCAGSKEGLFVYDGVNWEIFNKKTSNSLGSDEIVGLQFLNSKLWIATDNGACYFDGENFRSIYTGGRARAVSGVSDAKWAVGTAFGVIVNNNSQGSNIASNEISYMLYDKMGQLWIGTRKAGVYKYEGGSGRNFKGPGKSVMGGSLVPVPATPANCKLPGNLIKCILPYKGALAVGTTGGLCLTDFNGRYEVYTAEHKDFFQKEGRIVEESVAGNSDIPGNKVYGLAASDNDELLFVVTDLGLGILKDKKWLDVDKVIPGLPSDGISSVAWCKGDLWLGTDEDGLIRVKNLSALCEDDNK